jgi:predicted DNA-binding protein YlxM (UPF0122 family)
MPPLTRQQWQQARIEWESNPDLTITELAKRYGVARNTVYERIKREGWRKANIDDCKKNGPLPQSVQLYADNVERLLECHRHEWEEHRSLFELGAIAMNFELGKAAKISAEMLAIRQKAERMAWGLVSEDSSNAKEIVIERSYGGQE